MLWKPLVISVKSRHFVFFLIQVWNSWLHTCRLLVVTVTLWLAAKWHQLNKRENVIVVVLLLAVLWSLRFASGDCILNFFKNQTVTFHKSPLEGRILPADDKFSWNQWYMPVFFFQVGLQTILPLQTLIEQLLWHIHFRKKIRGYLQNVSQKCYRLASFC